MIIDENIHELQEIGEEKVSIFMSKVFTWMTAGLFATFLTAYYVASDQMLMNSILGLGRGIYLLFLVEIGLVMYISARINKISSSTAGLLFMVYSILNGLTLSVIFIAYTGSSLAMAFGTTTVLFSTMALIGYVTKKDLTKIGRLAMIGLIGIIVASIVNYFLGWNELNMIISAIGIVIFLGLTAYDTQKIKTMFYQAYGNPEAQKKVAILGALSLYLDFINLFLFLLRFMGSSRD